MVTEVEGGVAHVRLNRPDKMNGLDMAMFEGIIAAGEALMEDNRVRAVVLSGEGRGFCAGLDFKSFMASGLTQGEGGALLARDLEVSPANVAQRIGWIWREIEVPVIAAIHGVAFGGGLQLALGADLRIVAPDAELSVMEIKWGLIPDMSITKTLLDLVPLDVAKELTWTGRRVTGEEAVRLGLATRVSDDPLATALELARTIAGKSPDAIRRGKYLLDTAGGLDVQAAFELETTLQLELLGSKNQLEAVRANFMKQTPKFKDPEG